MIVEIERGNGMKELKVKKRGRIKNTILFATLAVPPVLTVTMLDVWFRHPVAALVLLGGSGVWDILFAVANTRKMPRAATRGVKSSAGKRSFAVYYITAEGKDAREEAAS